MRFKDQNRKMHVNKVTMWVQLGTLRDGPLENLSGGRAKYKKNSRKAKVNEKEFLHAN